MMFLGSPSGTTLPFDSKHVSRWIELKFSQGNYCGNLVRNITVDVDSVAK